MDDRKRLALHLSYELAGVTDRESYLDAMMQSLGAIFPSDTNGWVGTQLRTGALEMLGTNGSDRPEFNALLLEFMERHPMYTSYLGHSDISPRRISDLISDRVWRSHPIYAELFVPLGAEREMTIVVAPVGPADWHGWGFHRAHVDFTEAEVELARSIQPALITFNRLTCLAHDDEPADHRHLTDRETQVLQLVAQGFSAADISTVLRISPLTVRKHVEHVYEKLGEHNRIRAISVAIRDGIIRG